MEFAATPIGNDAAVRPRRMNMPRAVLTLASPIAFPLSRLRVLVRMAMRMVIRVVVTVSMAMFAGLPR
jgi:hypothetical protein